MKNIKLESSSKNASDNWVFWNIIYLWAIQTDYPVDISCAVIEVGHSNSMLAGGNPVLLSVWVNLEDMSSGAEDGLFPEGEREVMNLICTYYHCT